MKITELEDGASEEYCDSGSQEIVPLKAKRALVGAGARVLFYPTLMYNVLRNMMQAEFRWWDEIEQFLLLGAVPFPKDVPRLRQLGVHAVVTLNEPYETLVPPSLYKTHGIDHLVIPTRDYLFAPSPVDIRRAVDFIHSNASCGRTTYVHCKAGRGRSTTIVLCYLVKYRNMTATAALEYVRSKRPRVLLAPSQWQAVQDFKRQELESLEVKSTLFFSYPGDTVLITEADLEGYGSTEVEAKELKRIRKIALARPMMARVSCFFAALMASGDLPRLPPRLPEIRAC
ncbi:phosphatidylglycerophosphate phosphatase PTPMT2-like [Zingiber officinale]|uniref:phosphatidylglycerophosphate phosphatase PTPMT2-like n=1 Tax=Zingiber officinale TaxID=94328 RepID=UPI001C4D4A9B|nr:phosphatidylglycerophosphate phosphatase PTPMT2-like [Zingiber officinale]XP_042447485.1 phosphatidylglycerophosphate phosphatase PTPMT2-like [Zingiber officinale]XP_042447492.1 phosphatidylglycerophosphate phosphatase PTPMT2-like [Zingiber officinale]